MPIGIPVDHLGRRVLVAYPAVQHKQPVRQLEAESVLVYLMLRVVVGYHMRACLSVGHLQLLLDQPF